MILPSSHANNQHPIDLGLIQRLAQTMQAAGGLNQAVKVQVRQNERVVGSAWFGRGAAQRLHG